MTLRRASIVLMLASALVLVVGSAGFSTIAADRGVNVNVASDDRAYVGYDTEPITIRTDANGSAVEHEELVTVTNRFGGHDNNLEVVDVEYDVTGHAVSITDGSIDTPAPIDPGERGSIEGELRCHGTDTATVSVTVSVEATGVSAELEGDTETREFEVDCIPQDISVTTVEYNGHGSFEVQSDHTGTVQATVWVWEQNGDGRDTVTGTFRTNENINKADVKQKGDIAFTDGNSANFDIVAVEFPTQQENVKVAARAYIHPQWHTGEFDNGNPSGPGCPVDTEIGGTYLEEYEGCDTGDESENAGSSRGSGESNDSDSSRSAGDSRTDGDARSSDS
jgi:hypothetical protein